MKNIIATSLILFSALTVAKSQDPAVFRAREILDKVSEKTRSYKTIKADFTFTLDNLQAQVTDSHDGSILIKGDKFKIDLMGVETFNNGSTMWMFMRDVNEVNISDPEMMEDDLLNPATIFTIYEEGFRYIHAGESTIKGKTVDIIDLFPDKRNQPYTRIKLYIYRDSLQFAKIEQIGRDGTNYIIDINKMETNLTLDDSTFSFDTSKHPGIEVVDLR
ncbi:LolA family protein [Alkalitalea saponilacus]|uniref:Outer membrane lipoprotein-sorting protein n=1 Tax=Alkalitalea saponilacus TaxID=889453 RepID=A0A1T5H253_9BACT|nr:outer membrane lipoprotein carrier protein LolA [Alkalitalea saponilacus]ASB50920.1 cell envelope biogenesis protein LolA [Alkalitalea saponilacus]SKC14764.1 Outer membrane lipoprotein-sorting protein [Alkalitalea saponilacus]